MRSKEEIREALRIVSIYACNTRMCSQGCEWYGMYMDCPLWIIERRLKEDGFI